MDWVRGGRSPLSPTLWHYDQSDRLVTMKTMNASEFKAKCLAILDQVAATGEGLTILKHGKPVARLVPAAPLATESPQDSLRGTVEILGDVVGPVLDAKAWEAEGGEGGEP